MDDYKRQLYMEAQRRILAGDWDHVCCALAYTLADEGISPEHFTDENLALFPEFYRLFNNTRYLENGSAEIERTKEAWWETSWKEPRIRALDCILNMGV